MRITIDVELERIAGSGEVHVAEVIDRLMDGLDEADLDDLGENSNVQFALSAIARETRS